mmetsp:Transcript_46465/g.149060  ORF Transcript_46465/g.149060 Transcript_46465/m.149060 type:complete len:126 (-) Transcript_46465:107-484(-)
MTTKEVAKFEKFKSTRIARRKNRLYTMIVNAFKSAFFAASTRGPLGRRMLNKFIFTGMSAPLIQEAGKELADSSNRISPPPMAEGPPAKSIAISDVDKIVVSMDTDDSAVPAHRGQYSVANVLFE